MNSRKKGLCAARDDDAGSLVISLGSGSLGAGSSEPNTNRVGPFVEHYPCAGDGGKTNGWFGKAMDPPDYPPNRDLPCARSDYGMWIAFKV